MRRDEVTLLEELNLNAWPALRTVHLDGWLLRFAGGDTRRPNSVNMFAPSTVPLKAKIDAAEAIYRGWGRPCTFRFTPLVEGDLEPMLDERRYTSEGATFVQSAPTGRVAMPDGVEIFEQATEAWIEGALTLRGVSGDERDVFRAQHRAISVKAVWALARENGEAVACGCSTVERGWSGLTGIHVRKDARRRGLARKITEALMSWGASEGADRTWLQVDQKNSAAIPLYQSLGFRTDFVYHYRVQPNGDHI